MSGRSDRQRALGRAAAAAARRAAAAAREADAAAQIFVESSWRRVDGSGGEHHGFAVRRMHEALADRDRARVEASVLRRALVAQGKTPIGGKRPAPR